MKKTAIIQSNYIPWKGYFDIINMVDEFIIYDDVQYTRRDWRNRNVIKSVNGVQWLTIPVEVKGKYLQPIKDTLVSDENWNKKHWSTIIHNYSEAPFFKEYRSIFEKIYLTISTKNLSEINYKFIKCICEILEIETEITWSMDYQLENLDSSEKLISLCKQSNANSYLSGPTAKNYINEELFKSSGINIEWMDYKNYEEYSQLYPPFRHDVSIIDLIFNTGSNAKSYLHSKKLISQRL